MVYLLLSVYIIIYTRFINLTKTKPVSYLIFFTPVFALIVLSLGLQYNVGTDYYAYLQLAEGTKDLAFIERKSEMLFVYLIYMARWFNSPQVIFFLSGAIKAGFLALITYELKKRNFRLDYFFLLYFFLSLVFFNQFNTIRQFIAVYIIIYAIFMLINKKYILFLALVIIAGFFHSSALVFLPFVIMPKFIKKKYPARYVIPLLLIFMLISLVDMTPLIYRFVEMVPRYSSYIHASYMRRMGFTEIITKIPKLLIVLFSAFLIDKSEFGKKNAALVNMGYIACAVMIASFSSTVIWRIYMYFDLFIIFPVLILLQEKNKKIISVLIVAALAVMLVVKIILMPTGEYMYRSILFTRFW